MRRFDKLVRDGIPAAIEKKGDTYKAHRASEDEFDQKLKEKLQEEVDEFLEQPKVDELADIVEVVHALADHLGSSSQELEERREQKAKRLGRFRDRVILEDSS